MATPMSSGGWENALRLEGITKIVKTSGWATDGRDKATGKPFGPVHGALIHHTAGRDSLKLVQNGTSALPGPLCHDYLAKDGTLYLIGTGRTNHAGTTTPAVKEAIIAEKAPAASMRNGAETVDANDFLYGLEIENLGDGHDPYPEAQMIVARKWAAARLRYHGWSANSVWGHKEITTRKIDPSFDMVKFRKDVAALLTKPAGAKPSTPAPVTPKPADTVTVPKSEYDALVKAVAALDKIVKGLV